MLKIRLARMAKRARECSFEDLSTSQVPYVYVNKRRGPSFSDFTDFSWVHHVPLFIPTKEWPIPHVPYKDFVEVCIFCLFFLFDLFGG